MRSNPFIAFFFLLLAGSAQAQKEYKFDYVLQYEYEDTEAHKKATHFRFVNSKDNSYVLMVYEHQDEVTLQLIDAKSEVYDGTMPREDFFVSAIAMRCPRKVKYQDYRYEFKNFAFTNAHDSLINTTPYNYFEIKPTNKKMIEKENVRTRHYLYEPHTDFSKPVILPYAMVYEMWKDGGKKFGGLMKEEYALDDNRNKIKMMRLKEILKIEKIIIIDTNCN